MLWNKPKKAPTYSIKVRVLYKGDANKTPYYLEGEYTFKSNAQERVDEIAKSSADHIGKNKNLLIDSVIINTLNIKSFEVTIYPNIYCSW
jgi:hypothetical protein